MWGFDDDINDVGEELANYNFEHLYKQKRSGKMKYALYVDNKTFELKIRSGKIFRNALVAGDVMQYNEFYYLSTSRKQLVEKAKEIKEKWIKELDQKIEKVRSIEIK